MLRRPSAARLPSLRRGRRAEDLPRTTGARCGSRRAAGCAGSGRGELERFHVGPNAVDGSEAYLLVLYVARDLGRRQRVDGTADDVQHVVKIVRRGGGIGIGPERVQGAAHDAACSECSGPGASAASPLFGHASSPRRSYPRASPGTHRAGKCGADYLRMPPFQKRPEAARGLQCGPLRPSRFGWDRLSCARPLFTGRSMGLLLAYSW